MQHLIRGVNLHWRESGAGDPLIFIHGFPFDCAMWEPQLSDVPEGWWFIAPDLRGFGQSNAPGDKAFTMNQFADDIIGLMDHLQIDQAVICGVSMGGYVAFSLAYRHPDRVRALVLVATRANADSDEAKKGRRELAKRVRKEGVQAVIDAMLLQCLSAHTEMKRPDIVERVRNMMERQDPESMVRALVGMAERKDYTTELDRITIPTLIVRGDQDEIIPAGDMERIAREIRGARHEVMALTGHLPNLEAPDVFNSTVNKYLKYLPPALKLGDMSMSF